MATFGVSYGDERKTRGIVRDNLDRRMADDGRDSSDLLDGYNTKYREYIDLVDQLRSFGLERELPLPQVAVIGVQTSGKSSVLEAISGVSLPRGTGTVTRCPIELRLKFNPDHSEPWHGHIYAKNEKNQEYEADLKVPENVATEVERAQRFVAGESGFSNQGIILEIRSQFVPDLTLVDLPGLIEVAMDGVDSKAPEMVESMLSMYMEKKETIIMVVVPCTMEIATTKALKMALNVDKDGNRTLGVLTKPDLVDRGAEADIVTMVNSPDRYKIRKGFTIVKLRSKEDVDSGMPLHVAFSQEKDYFKSHPFYGKLPKHAVGIESLAHKLTYELVERIKSVLPSLKSDVHLKLHEVDSDLNDLGLVIPDAEHERRQLLTDLLNEFTDKVCRITEGIYDKDVPTDQKILLYTRTHMETFATIVTQSMPDDHSMRLKAKIERELNEERGMELPGFLSYQACRNVIQRLLMEYKSPARNCLHNINTAVEDFLRKLGEEKFGLFPRLESQVKGVLDQINHEEFIACELALGQLFDIESMVVVPDVLFYKGQHQDTRDNISDDGSYTLAGGKVEDFPTGPMIGGHPGQLYEQQAQANQQGGGKKNWWAEKRGKKRGEKDKVDKNLPNAVGAPTYPTDLPPKPFIPQTEADEKEHVHFTLDRIVIYFTTALDRLMATVPARIHYHLIHQMAKVIKSRVSNLATDPDTLDNLVEHDRTADIRSRLTERRLCLERSLEELNRF